MNNPDVKSLIKKAFLKLYSKKGAENITVKELCSHVPVARTTFYLHFRNIGEVKSEIEDALINDLYDISVCVSENLDDKNIIIGHFERVSDFIVENKYEFTCFLLDQPNFDFISKWKNLIKSFTPVFFENNPAAQELISEVIAGAVIAGQTCILKNIDSIDNKEIRNIAVSALLTAVETGKTMNTFGKFVV